MINKIISAVSIHSGGGFTYFLLIKSSIDKKNTLIFLDYRAKQKLQPFKNAKVLFLKKGPFRNLRILFKRIIYQTNFLKNRNKYFKDIIFKEIFLSGIPPFFRIPFRKNQVFILCQNKLVFEDINIEKILSLNDLKNFIYILIYKICFNLFKRSKDILIVQTKSMKKKLISVGNQNQIIFHDYLWDINNKDNYNNVFFISDLQLKKSKAINKIKKIYKRNIIFFYPAYYHPHKNHFNLINAFGNIDKKIDKSYKLILTIQENNNDLFKDLNSNIILFKDLSCQEVFNIYKYVDYLIFPSLSESYGLPLIEAKLNGVKIISSNLDYVYDVCNPFLVFNPFSIEDIYKKIIISIKSNKRF